MFTLDPYHLQATTAVSNNFKSFDDLNVIAFQVQLLQLIQEWQKILQVMAQIGLTTFD
jgi:hypothetical protein